MKQWISVLYTVTFQASLCVYVRCYVPVVQYSSYFVLKLALLLASAFILMQ